MSSIPFSPAAERNRSAIGDSLTRLLSSGRAKVLEIGSGTGQHAVYFTQLMPELCWQCSDVAENLPGLQARIDAEGQGRLPDAIALDVMGQHWPDRLFDAVFSANTLHIMPWSHTSVLLDRVAERLKAGGRLILYGPFHDLGVHTAPSNAAFDASLRRRDPAMGVRDAVAVTALAAQRGLRAEANLPLPANNRLLVFCRL